MPKYISGRVPTNGPSGVSTERYEFLGLEDAEPNLGVAPAENSVVSTGTTGARVLTDTPTVGGVNVTGVVTATTGIITTVDANTVDVGANLYAVAGVVTTLTSTDFVGTAGTITTFTSTDQTGTCLLYTSPSPRDGLLSRMPSSA